MKNRIIICVSVLMLWVSYAMMYAAGYAASYVSYEYSMNAKLLCCISMMMGYSALILVAVNYERKV